MLNVESLTPRSPFIQTIEFAGRLPRPRTPVPAVALGVVVVARASLSLTSRGPVEATYGLTPKAFGVNAQHSRGRIQKTVDSIQETEAAHTRTVNLTATGETRCSRACPTVHVDGGKRDAPLQFTATATGRTSCSVRLGNRSCSFASRWNFFASWRETIYRPDHRCGLPDTVAVGGFVFNPTILSV